MKRVVFATFVLLLSVSASPSGVHAAPIGIEATHDQTGVVEGTVTAAVTAQPLAGAQVYVLDSDLGALTGSDGTYRIENVPVGEVTVAAQLLGFGPAEQTATISEGETVTLNFEMAEEALALDAIVVTGQAGQARRREIGHSLTQINVSDAVERASTLEQLLQGGAPGVRVSFTDASVGSGAAIRLRGNVSVTQGNQPLVYIDGVRQAADGYRSGGNTKQASPLDDINPADVERMEVIKGAAASTLYGSEAAAGVIQIFTRRGGDGDPQFTYETDQSVSWVRAWGSDERPRMNMDPWLRTAHGQRHNLSVQGGAERFRYHVSGSLTDRDGAQVDEFENRYSLRSNVSVNPTESLAVDVNSMFSHHAFETQPSGNALASIFFNVYRAPNNFVGGARAEDPEFVDQINLLRARSSETTNQRQNLGITANWTPTDALATRVTFGYDRLQQDQMVVLPFGYVTNPDGSITTADWHNEAVSVDAVANYEVGVTESLRTTFSAGGELVQRQEHSMVGSGSGLPGPGRHTLSSTAQQSVSQTGLLIRTGGLFVQNMLDFSDRYFITTGVRVDGSSVFGDDFGLEVYPKLSTSYIISDEAFWPDHWGVLQLRAAYGFAGRAPDAFDAVRTWTPTSFRDQTSFTPSNVGNPELGPERTGELELGFEGSFLDERIGIDFTYYRQNSTDALLNVGQSPSLGFGGSQIVNVGELRNTGFELGTNVTLVRSPDLAWDLGLNVTTNQSEILDMGGVVSYTLVEGQPAPAIRGHRILNKDEFADPEIERDAFFGPAEPTHIIGLSTSLNLPYGVMVTARGEYMGGHYVNEFASNLLAQRGPGALGCDHAYRIVPHGEYSGPGDTHPNLDQLRAYDRALCYESSQSAMWRLPQDFARLREISARAPLPVTIPGTSDAFVTLSARNLARWVNHDFYSHDPETQGAANPMGSLTGGSVTDHVPAPATITASLRVTF
jgi:TonB-dependent starch-binding outer membrane protein SusC